MQHRVSVVNRVAVLVWKAWQRLFNVDKKVSSWISHFDVRDVRPIQTSAVSYHFLCQVLLKLFVPSILWALPLPLLGADFQTQKHDDAVHGVISFFGSKKRCGGSVDTSWWTWDSSQESIKLLEWCLLDKKSHYNVKLFYLCLVWCFLSTAVSLFISCFFLWLSKPTFLEDNSPTIMLVGLLSSFCRPFKLVLSTGHTTIGEKRM
jgi:hypothetical protein